MPISTLTKVQPADVHGVLARHMLADGFDLVFDYERSHGSWLHDARTGREYLDFITFTASNPIGFNHPGMKEPEFLKVLYRVAQLKPALSDLYSVEYAQFVETMGRLAVPSYMKYAFFVEGGTLGVENALKAAFDWKVRRNKAKGVAGAPGLHRSLRENVYVSHPKKPAYRIRSIASRPQAWPSPSGRKNTRRRPSSAGTI